MRALFPLALLLVYGCSPGLVFNSSQSMTEAEMENRASLIFIGVIEAHHLESWPLFSYKIAAGDLQAAKYWRVLRRTVRVETLIRGEEPRQSLDIYEIFWTGGATGNWNATQDNERALFLVRKENGKYHVVRDWWRSIFPVTSGRHDRLPLDSSHALWERVALLNFWITSDQRSQRFLHYNFPPSNATAALGEWRVVKLERGLVRHPSAGVRIPGCLLLLQMGAWGQDECWDILSDSDRQKLSEADPFFASPAKVAAVRHEIAERSVNWYWRRFRDDLDSLRLLTTINNARLRREFCHLWDLEYPTDHDNGCPADQPPPATIVTEAGDISLQGPWPSQ